MQVLESVYSPKANPITKVLVALKGSEAAQASIHARGQIIEVLGTIALKLISDDNQWQRCLEEAIRQETNIKKIRFLFATICMHCNPINPDPFQLWNTNVDSLILDYVRKGVARDQAITKALKVLYFL